VSMVPFTGVLCKMSSDVHHMARKELRHDRDVVLLLAGHLWGTSTGAAKPNAKTRGTGSVLNPGFGDFGLLTLAYAEVGLVMWSEGFCEGWAQMT